MMMLCDALNTLLKRQKIIGGAFAGKTMLHG
jgi:hypothetical protein